MWATALVSPPARPDLLPVEGAVLRADEGLPAVLQEGLLSHLGDGRIHLQNSTGRGESRMQLYTISFTSNERLLPPSASPK